MVPQNKITIQITITDPKAVRYITAAAAWHRQSRRKYLKQTITRLARDQFNDVREGFSLLAPPH